MNRLTSERCNGIKTGYWSPAKKEDLIQRLAAYENTGLEPEEIKAAGKDRNVPTADEMFQEAGFEKTMETSVCIEYKERKGVSIIEVNKKTRVIECHMYGSSYGLCYEEILACAQLIREMEKRNG